MHPNGSRLEMASLTAPGSRTRETIIRLGSPVSSEMPASRIHRLFSSSIFEILFCSVCTTPEVAPEALGAAAGAAWACAAGSGVSVASG